MSHVALSSARASERERERVILCAILSPLAAIALVYGIVSAHPPLLFLAASGLSGVLFIAVLLWGQRRKRTILASCLAFAFFYEGRFALEHLFFARPYDESSVPSAAFIVEMAAFVLGCVLGFALSRLQKSSPTTPAASA